MIRDAIEKMMMLSRVMPGDLVLVACHLHKDPAAQIRDQRLIVRQPGNRTDRLGSKPKTDAHRASRERILSETPRQLDRADHTRPVVIRLHRMTGMCLYQELACFQIHSTLWVDDRGR